MYLVMKSTSQKFAKPEESLTPISTKKRYSTSVETKRLSKNTKNVLKNEKTNETISIPPMRDLDVLEKNTVDPDTKPFYHGNPFVEKHRGVMHLHKENLESSEHPQINNCCMLVMMDIPAFFTCRELVSFVRPSSTHILLMKIVRDETANKYMVTIKFKTPESATKFYEQYNGLEFNSIEPEKCSLRFVDTIEAEGDDSTTFTGLHVDPAYGETRTCSVCLERMEEGNNMLLIILCCPICRYTQTPEIVPDQKCFDCGRTSDLWMCLICGNIGCGRYAAAHAYKHYETTSHIFTLQIGGKLVWDYAGDNYVHRLIESSTDGKPVEYEGVNNDSFEKEKEKISAVQLEYTCLLTSQLENQRLFYEEKLRESDERFNEYSREAQQKINSLEAELKSTRNELTSTSAELVTLSNSKKQLDKKYLSSQTKCQTLQNELEEEKQMSKLLRIDKELLSRKLEETNQKRKIEVGALEEQIHDLLLHFETEAKIKEQIENGAVSKEELEQSNVEVKEDVTPKVLSKKSRRRKK
ncbi:unnamed protein product [Meloidogyne enterolobii]|uniref:Uncharacterized protein n=1 Tax=Meloidogyne enterolobii TaxID=390850 RepID=A0ACB0Z7W8_MELEN